MIAKSFAMALRFYHVGWGLPACAASQAAGCRMWSFSSAKTTVATTAFL